MAATDRPSRCRPRLLVALAGLVTVAAGLVVVRGDRAGEVPAPPALPAVGRADVDLTVAARRHDGDVVVALVVAVADDARVPLRVVDWGGTAGGWSARSLWEEDLPPRWWWSPAVRDERPSHGRLVLHVGPGLPADHGVLRVEAPVERVRAVPPGREVGAEARATRAGASEVRVCVWAAGTGPGDAGARPAACADDRV